MLFQKPTYDWMIAGLGNPGPEYEKTRHNTGFMSLDLLAARLQVKVSKERFKALTVGKTVILGRKTLDTFPGGKPLKDRRNIVLSRRELDIPGAEIAHSFEEAAALGGDDAIVIGGASVNKASIANVIIDIVSSIAMNQSTEWWMYEYAMTLYVASMPLLAAVWVCYEYVLIHRDEGTAPSCAASWASCFRTSSLSPWPSRTRGRSGSST